MKDIIRLMDVKRWLARKKELPTDPTEQVWKLLASLWWRPGEPDNTPEDIERVINSIDSIIPGFSQRTLSGRSVTTVAEALRNSMKVDICFEYQRDRKQCENVFVSVGYACRCQGCEGKRGFKWTSE